ncbi:MAG: hypothetical protein OEX14_13745 [Paracoccaceae bacterium]|nr:hypothetical protein [Paracoccaceae bacterium]
MSWFKPKTYGYGASPANWKGWAATVGFLVIELVLVWVLLLRPILTSGEPTFGQIIVWAFCSGALTIGFIWLTKAKTDGAWRWRWGKGD